MLFYIYSILILLYRRNTINNILMNYLIDIGCLSYIYYYTDYDFQKNETFFLNQTH